MILSENPRIEFTCEDNMELMGRYPDKRFELAIVDPPYQGNDAIGLKDNKGKNKQATKRTVYKVFDNIMPTDDYFNLLGSVSKNQIVWGGNFFGLTGGVIAWNKNGTAFGEGEIAICTTHKSVKFFEFTWNGMIQGNMKEKENRVHPTQKPVALYKWLLQNYAKEGDTILDTHVGSGSIMIACWELGFDFVGCELDKDYYDAAVKRFREHVQAHPKLFTPKQLENQQLSIL